MQPQSMPNGESIPSSSVRFTPVVLNALYAGTERGLQADLLATRALGGVAYSVCTMLVAASHGTVTDVLAVPSDSIDAQLQHVMDVTAPTGVKIGIVGDAQAVRTIFRRLSTADVGPVVLDLTLSGPTGEDLINQRGVDALREHLAQADIVLIRTRDASLLAGMEIASLDDAQVAVQRMSQLGARKVLLRCGHLPARFFDTAGDADPAFYVDLFYDGEEFGLFEKPHIPLPHVRGSSSALSMALLRQLVDGATMTEALQASERFVTESLRESHNQNIQEFPSYFWHQSVRRP